MRAFESVGGLAAIVKVLKDKTVAQPVRFVTLKNDSVKRAKPYELQDQGDRDPVLLPAA